MRILNFSKKLLDPYDTSKAYAVAKEKVYFLTLTHAHL